MNILMTVEELAKYLKIKPDTIYKKVRKGELPAIKLGKMVRFRKEAIDQWIIEHANKTMKDVKAARDAVEAKVEEAVKEVRKTAKVASKVIGEVPDMISDVKKAPLNKKQEALTKGLKTLWTDFNAGLGRTPRARAQKKTAKKTKKSTRKSEGKTTAIRTAAEPEAPRPPNLA